MNLQAIRHTPLSHDAFAVGEKAIAVRLRAAKHDIKKASVAYGDRMKEPVEVKEVVMEKIASDQLFDYFEAVIQDDYTRICYYFSLQDEKNRVYYYKKGFFDKISNIEQSELFQFPFIRREDRIDVPEWAMDAVMYQIFPDSFATSGNYIAGKPSAFHEYGNSYVAKNGGTLRGIEENAAYLESLGVDCIYLNPIFKANHYHKYDTVDYFEIDPCFGDMDDLKSLVNTCHTRGIRVILDGVFNHCGSHFFAFEDVLLNGENSKYKDWFYHLVFPVKYENPPNYDAFSYSKDMPKLNTGNPEVMKYFTRVGTYWIEEAGIDGWRLDVANEVNHEFWRLFRREVRNVKPDAFLIGEIWEDAEVWLMGDQFDSTMNYTFTYICREFFGAGSIGVREFDEKINQMVMRYQTDITLTQMNFLDSHDVPRFLHYCSGDVRKLKLAFFFLFTCPGVPCVYYGDEKLINGFTEPEYRAPMIWRDNGEQAEMTRFIRDLAALRREKKALRRGSLRTVLVDEEQNVYAFSREYEGEKSYIVLNNSEKEAIVTINCQKAVLQPYEGIVR